MSKIIFASFHCSALTLFESSMILGELLLTRPMETLEAFDKALRAASRIVLDDLSDADRADLVSMF